MQIFFNSSMPRSGSELLQVILHQNPLIYASPTSPLLEFQFAARSILDLPEVKSQPQDLMTKAFIAMCGQMAQGYYSAITDRPFVVDKSRGWIHYIEWLQMWQDSPKIVCVIRDLRNIISSMELVYRKNRHLPIGPDNPNTLQALTINGRTRHWLESKPVGLALQRTYDAISKGLRSNILFIRYEDLCSSPDLIMAQLYQYLEVDFFQHDFNNLRKEVVEIEDVFGPYGNHSVGSALRQSSTDWLSILGKNVGDLIVQEHRWYFDNFYADRL
jgi:sulfotransferase